MRQGLNRRTPLISFVCACLLLAVSAGCAVVPEPVVELFENHRPDEVLEVKVIADAAINPDLNGRPSPVVLRVYQLKRELQFRTSDFFALYDNDLKLLADDLVGRKEYMVNPGAAMDLEITADPGARYVALLGAFRDLDNGVAKVIAPLDADDPEPVYALLSASQIQLLDRAAYRRLLKEQERESTPDA